MVDDEVGGHGGVEVAGGGGGVKLLQVVWRPAGTARTHGCRPADRNATAACLPAFTGSPVRRRLDGLATVAARPTASSAVYTMYQ